jgi:hypothetical protein
VPLPVTIEDTSNSAQVEVAMFVTLPTPEPLSAVRLFQVSPVSVQVLAVVNTEGPFAVGLVAHRRSVALWTVPDRPETEKRKKVWTSGSVPPSTRSAVEVPVFAVGLASFAIASAVGVKVAVAAAAGSGSATATITMTVISASVQASRGTRTPLRYATGCPPPLP